jgi:hypothetical protein
MKVFHKFSPIQRRRRRGLVQLFIQSKDRQIYWPISVSVYVYSIQYTVQYTVHTILLSINSSFVYSVEGMNWKRPKLLLLSSCLALPHHKAIIIFHLVFILSV